MDLQDYCDQLEHIVLYFDPLLLSGDSGEPQVAVTSPGTGFEADMSHSLPSQRSTERHVAFQNIPGRPPSSASSAPGAVRLTLVPQTLDVAFH